MSGTKSGTKKSDMFAKLAAQQQAGSPNSGNLVANVQNRSVDSEHNQVTGEVTPVVEPVQADTPTPVSVSPQAAVPLPPHVSRDAISNQVRDTQAPARNKGKRENPDYCQANAYLPKRLRKEVDRALLDIDDLDYSTLVETLLRQWLAARGVSV